jgi:hypothetical protein
MFVSDITSSFSSLLKFKIFYPVTLTSYGKICHKIHPNGKKIDKIKELITKENG